MTPEARIVLLSAGSDEAPARVAAQAPGGLDWARLLPLAHREGALPRIAALANRDVFPDMPATVRQQLATLMMLHEFRAGMIEDRARALLTLLADAGIDALLLKGAALAATVYPRFADRPMGDVDLLIDARNAARCMEIALTNGWQRSEKISEAEAFYAGHQHLHPLCDRQKLNIGLDLHVDVLPSHAPFQLPLDQLRAAARPAAELADARPARSGRTTLPALVPAPEYMLLHACVHFAWAHTAEAGAWKLFRDVYYLLRSPLFQPDDFLRLAEAARAGSCVHWSLRLAYELGGVEEAGSLLARLQPARSSWKLRALTRHFSALLTGTLPPAFPVRLRNRLWEMALAPDREGHAGVRPWSRNQLLPAGSIQREHAHDPAAGPRLARLRDVLTYLSWMSGTARR